MTGAPPDRQRIDKWLWHARVVRTRSAAAALANQGLVRVNGLRIDAASRPVRPGEVVTVALDAMKFIRPVKVGDVLCVYTEVEHIGRTSMRIHVEAWARRFSTHSREKVTDATFTFVAIDEAGKPRPVSV